VIRIRQRYLPPRDGHEGFSYAFVIGFVVSSRWGQNNAADGNARAEGAAAVQTVRDAVKFEAPDRDRAESAEV
jgi:hypothetical protein